LRDLLVYGGLLISLISVKRDRPPNKQTDPHDIELVGFISL
jgi:hypothetical protein